MNERFIDILDGDTVVKLARECVAERGEDFVYEKNEESSCAYVHDVFYEDEHGIIRDLDPVNYTPGCLAGMILNKAGVPLKAFVNLGINFDTSAKEAIHYLIVANYIGEAAPEAVLILQDMQAAQDSKKTWGEAFVAGTGERPS